MSASEKQNVVILEGEWDLGRKDELIEVLGALRKDEPATIDLRAVTYVDSTMLSILAILQTGFAKMPIKLLAPQPQILRVLRIVRFQDLFEIVEA